MQLREREIKFVLWHCLGIQIIYLIDIRWNRERERDLPDGHSQVLTAKSKKIPMK